MALTLNQVWGELGDVDVNTNTGTPDYDATTSPPDYGTRYCRMTAADLFTINLYDHISDAGGNLLAGFYWRTSDKTPAGEVDIFAFEGGSPTLGTFNFEGYLETDGDLRLVASDGSTIATVSDPFTNNTWHRLEFLAGRTSSSIFKMWIDGSSVIDTSGIDLLGTDGATTYLEIEGIGSTTVDFGAFYCFTDASDGDQLSAQGNGHWGVKRYLSDATGDSQDVIPVSGDAGTLDDSGWADTQEIPLSDTNLVSFTSADSAAIDFDDATNGGPSGDADVGTIFGYKYWWRAARGNGAATTHTVYWGDNNDAPTWPAARQKTLSLTTSAVDYFEVSGSEGPSTSEYFTMGFGRGSGGRDFLLYEMIPTLLFVPTSAPEGAGAQTLPSLTQAGVGLMQPDGTAAQTLAALAQAGVAVLPPSGTGAQTLAALAQAGIAAEVFAATSAQTLPALLQAGSATHTAAAGGVPAQMHHYQMLRR